MKKIISILTTLMMISLVGCGADDNRKYLTGKWELDCSYKGGIVSGLKGSYNFNDGIMEARMSHCYPDELTGEAKSLFVSIPYVFEDEVELGNGLTAIEMRFLLVEGDILALVYKDEETNSVYWSWGLDNTSLEHSVFGFFVVDEDPVWGGYPVRKDPENPNKYYPVKEDFPEQSYPTTISFDDYLIED